MALWDNQSRFHHRTYLSLMKCCAQKILICSVVPDEFLQLFTMYLTDRKTRCAVQPRLWFLWLHGESDGCSRLEHQRSAQRRVLHRERCHSDPWSQVAADDRSTGTGTQVDQKHGERKGTWWQYRHRSSYLLTWHVAICREEFDDRIDVGPKWFVNNTLNSVQTMRKAATPFKKLEQKTILTSYFY